MKKALAPLLPFLVLSCVWTEGHPMGWGHMNWGWGGAFMGFLWVALIALIIYLVVRGQSFGTRETPLDILKKRYARGEISKEEFERMKEDLEG